MANTELSSRIISCLRFPLTLGVVFIHYNIANGSDPWWVIFIINLISEVISRIAVPLFFLISGFLFFYHTEFSLNIYVKKLKKRYWSLFVPFILWNILAICKMASHKIAVFSKFYPDAQDIEIRLSLTRIINTLFNYDETNGIFIRQTANITPRLDYLPYPIDMPLWFVRDLMIVVILSPLIYWFIKKSGLKFILFLGVVWYFLEAIFFQGNWFVLLSRAFFFFSWGAYFSINNLDAVKEMQSHQHIVYLYFPLAILDATTQACSWNIFIHQAGILLGIFGVITISSHFIHTKSAHLFEKFQNCSFFVFALHTLIIRDIAKLIFTAIHIPGNGFGVLFSYFSVPIATTTICVMLYWVLKRFFPPVLALLTGGRQ